MITIPINNIRLEGIIAKAVSVPSNFLSSQEQEKEKVPSINKNNFSQDKFDISYKTTHPLEDSSFVAFKDPMNDKWVILSLKNDTISRLKEHFGEDDFYQKENGIIRLDNKAEAYVAGWYADIAYKRGFLEADRNNDGILDKNEYSQTKNDFEGYGTLIINGAIEQITKSYVKVSENTSDIVRYNNDYYKRPQNLDEELDTTLRINKDFDKKITLREAYNVNERNSLLSDLKLMDNHIKEAVKKGYVSKEAIEYYLKIDEKDKLTKKLKALQKLLMNPNSLTQEEKELVRPELEALKKKKLNKDKLNEIINSLKAQNKYLENMAFAMES